MLMGEEEEDWEAIERAHNRELLTRLVLQIAATCLTVRALALPPTPYPNLNPNPDPRPRRA